MSAVLSPLSPPAPSPSLEYAPGAPIRRRKRIRRIILLLLLLCVGLAGWRWGPAIKLHVELLYWQRQCMNYQIPPTVILWEQDPQKAATVLRQPNPDYEPILYSPGTVPPFNSGLFHPRALREFDTRASFPVTAGQSVVFLHERRTPSGKRRLVVVYSSPWAHSTPEWAWRVYEPALFSKPKLLSTGQSPPDLSYMMYSGYYIPHRVGLGPGQPDPADPSRFTFPLLSSSQQFGAYDGRLTDQDTIEIKVRPRKP